jgi:hypothetical protein
LTIFGAGEQGQAAENIWTDVAGHLLAYGKRQLGKMFKSTVSSSVDVLLSCSASVRF